MKLAFICGGRTYEKDSSEKDQLQFIGNSVEKVTETLESHGWKCEPIEKLQSTKAYTDVLTNYKGETIDEFLFYFTGHGLGSISIEFEIFLETHELTIEQLVKSTKNKLGRFPKKMALVIDSCYSGNALKYTYDNIEILSSTNRGVQGFEKDSLGMSIFSHYFCEAFNSPTEFDHIDLELIAEFVKNSQDGQEPLYSKALRREKIVIGYNQEINKLKKLLTSKYDSPKQLKEKIFNYYSSKESNFDNFREADSFEKLFSILIKEKPCLFCMLKRLGEESGFLQEVSDTSCDKLEQRAINRRKVSKLILIVDGEKFGLKNSLIRGFIGYDNGTYLGLDDSDEVDLSSLEQCKIEIPLYMASVLKDKKLSRTVDLELILPNELMLYNYQELEIPLGKSKPTPINSRFNILKRLTFRIENHHLIDFYDEIELWEANSKICEEQLTETLTEALIERLKEKEEIELFNKHDNHVCMLSNQSLNESIEEIAEWGVPVVFYPHSDYDMIEKIVWNTCCVEDIKSVLTRFMTYEFKHGYPTHLIYDNYYDVDFLPNKEY